MAKKKPSKKKSSSNSAGKIPSMGTKKGVKRRAVGTHQDAYRVVVVGGLANGANDLYDRLQASRKFRRLASGDMHEILRECIDRGMQDLERELDDEERMREDGDGRR